MAGKKKHLSNLNPDKQWGGKREGGGFPAKWRSGNAKPVRIPERLHDAVLNYAHALDDNQPLSPENNPDSQPQQGIIQPDAQGQTMSAEDIRQMQLTLEAVRGVLEQWRDELKKHNIESPRWRKANELFDALDTHLSNRWL